MTPAEERIETSRLKIEEQYLTALERKEYPGPEEKVELTWEEAIDKMMVGNTTLIQADFRIVQVEDGRKQIWRRFIPSLTASVSDSFLLGNLSDAFDSPNYRIRSFIGLGNLFDLPARFYQQKITLIGAHLNAELTFRQETVRLYRLFRQRQLLDEQREFLALEEELIREIQKDRNLRDARRLHDFERRQERWKERESQWTSQMNDLLMSKYTQIRVDIDSLPELHYTPEDLNLRDTERWGHLQLSVMAMEDLAEQGRFRDTYMRYLPRVNFNVSTPPLFTDTDGFQFDVDDVRLSSSANWRLDTRGDIGRQLERLKRNKYVNDWRRDRRQDEEVKNLLEGIEQLREVQENRRKLEEAKEFYIEWLSVESSQNPQSLIEGVTRVRELELSLREEEIKIFTEFWLFDEKNWDELVDRWVGGREKRLERIDKEMAYIGPFSNF